MVIERIVPSIEQGMLLNVSYISGSNLPGLPIS